MGLRCFATHSRAGATYDMIGRGVIASFLQSKAKKAHPAAIFWVGVFFRRRSLAFLFFLLGRQKLDRLSYRIGGRSETTSFDQDITDNGLVRVGTADHLTGLESLKAGRFIRHHRAIDGLRNHAAVAAHVSRKAYVRLNVSDPRDFGDFRQSSVVEDPRRRFVGPKSRAAAVTGIWVSPQFWIHAVTAMLKTFLPNTLI